LVEFQKEPDDEKGHLVTRKRAAQKQGLEKMVRASERAGLYDKELEGLPFDTADDTSPVPSRCLSDNLPLLSPRLTTVLVHAGAYQAHDLLSAMPLVCTGTRLGVLGETLWERTARALQHVQPDGPYPRSDVLTVFVLDDGRLTTRFDVSVTWRGAIAWIVVDNIPRIKHAPISVGYGDDLVTVARKIFSAGLPP
jgi:hypothetical protein